MQEDTFTPCRFWYGVSWEAACRSESESESEIIEITCQRGLVESNDALSGQQLQEQIAKSLEEDGYPPIEITVHKIWAVEPGSDYP